MRARSWSDWSSLVIGLCASDRSVAVVETQKGAIEIETFQSGQIEQILVNDKSKVPVGTPLARIRTDLEGPLGAVAAALPPAAPAVPLAAPPLVRAPVAPPSPPPVAFRSTTRTRVSPAARRLAEAHGIDLSTVTGIGPAGAVTYGDVERRLGEAVTPSQRKRALWLDLGAMRTAIAAAMARSKARNSALLS